MCSDFMLTVKDYTNALSGARTLGYITTERGGKTSRGHTDHTHCICGLFDVPQFVSVYAHPNLYLMLKVLLVCSSMAL